MMNIRTKAEALRELEKIYIDNQDDIKIADSSILTDLLNWFNANDICEFVEYVKQERGIE